MSILQNMSLFCNSGASMLCDQTWCACAYSYCMSVCLPVCNWFSIHICSLSFISWARLQLQLARGKESYLKKSEPHQVSKWRRGRMRARQGREGGVTEQKQKHRGKENDKTWRGEEWRMLHKSGENGGKRVVGGRRWGEGCCQSRKGVRIVEKRGWMR